MGRGIDRVWGCGLAIAAWGCNPPEELYSGFDVDPLVRAALAEDGTVVAASANTLYVVDGTATTSIDLASESLALTPYGTPKRTVQVQNGDVVFVADRTVPVPGCLMGARGAYHTTTSGGPILPLFEGCKDSGVGIIRWEIAMSPNGTVAVSQITNGQGALLRGPAAGPLATLRSGTGTFYNTQGLDVNDSGRVAIEMEYFDGFAGGLMRGVLLFDAPEQEKAEIDTAVEKLGIGQQPWVAINGSGTVAFRMPSSFTMLIEGAEYSYDAGIYTAIPTLFNTPKMLTLVADYKGDFCALGNLDINDAGVVVFEAKLSGPSGCSIGSGYDGIFDGPTAQDVVVVRGDAALEGHQYFDAVYLGELNNSDEISFITTYSEPLVDPVKVWRQEL